MAEWVSITMGKAIPDLEKYKVDLQLQSTDLQVQLGNAQKTLDALSNKIHTAHLLLNSVNTTLTHLVTDLAATGVSMVAIPPPESISAGGGWARFFSDLDSAENRPGTTIDGAVAGIVFCAQAPTLAGVYQTYEILKKLISVP